MHRHKHSAPKDDSVLSSPVAPGMPAQTRVSTPPYASTHGKPTSAATNATNNETKLAKNGTTKSALVAGRCIVTSTQPRKMIQYSHHRSHQACQFTPDCQSPYSSKHNKPTSATTNATNNKTKLAKNSTTKSALVAGKCIVTSTQPRNMLQYSHHRSQQACLLTADCQSPVCLDTQQDDNSRKPQTVTQDLPRMARPNQL